MNAGIFDIIDIHLIVNCDLTLSIVNIKIQIPKLKLFIVGCKSNHQRPSYFYYQVNF
jgi:hypothetical protein